MKKDESLQIPHTLIVDISSDFGGANARILALMKQLPHDRVGLATISGSMIADELEALGYAVHRLAVNKFDPRIPFRMTKIIRDCKYELVDTQNPQSKLWGSIAAVFGNIPLISTLNSWYMNEHPRYSLRWFVYSLIEFLTNYPLARYIVVSREIQEAMVKKGIKIEKIDLIYNAIELDMNLVIADRKKILEKYHLPDSSVICLAAGRLVWAKSHEILIDAIAKARINNLNLYCLIAGEGELKKKLMKRIKILGLEGYVILLGYVDHKKLLSLLKACDIFVMPSRTEGTPLALLEAAMLGKPIIASNVGGIPELIKHEEHGILIEPGKQEVLTNAILRLVSDYPLGARLGDQAQKWVKKNYSLFAQARFTADSYTKAKQLSR